MSATIRFAARHGVQRTRVGKRHGAWWATRPALPPAGLPLRSIKCDSWQQAMSRAQVAW